MNIRFEKEYLEETVRYLKERIKLLKSRPEQELDKTDLTFDISNSLCVTLDRLEQNLIMRESQLECINNHIQALYDISKELGDDYHKIIDLKLKGYTLDRIAMDMNMSRSTVVRRINEVENNKKELI